jgi:hypothetical protein
MSSYRAIGPLRQLAVEQLGGVDLGDEQQLDQR